MTIAAGDRVQWTKDGSVGKGVAVSGQSFGYAMVAVDAVNAGDARHVLYFDVEQLTVIESELKPFAPAPAAVLVPDPPTPKSTPSVRTPKAP